MTSPAAAHGAPASTLVLRPSRRTHRANRVAGPAAVLLAAVIALRAAQDGLIALVGVLALMSAAAYVVHRYLTRVRVEVSAGGVLHAGLLRTRQWPWPAIGTLVLVERLVPPAGLGYEYLIALDRRGRRLFQVTSQVWAGEERARLAAAFGEVVRLRGDTTPAELHARYPGALSFAQRHPLWTGVLLTLAMLPVIAVTAYLVAGPS